jgi:hypothetical protein
MISSPRARLCSLLVGLAAFADGPSAVAADASPAAPAAPARTDPEPPPIDLRPLPLVGDKDGILYLRDPLDILRLYPQAQVDLDAHGSIGPHVDALPASEAGVDLAPRFFVRRTRLELAGEAFLRGTFDVGLDLAANPAIDGSRVDGNRTVVALANAWGELEAGRGLRLTGGVFPAPFSLENRTATSDLAMMERNIAIRGFVVPGGPVLGAAISGSTRRERVTWNAGVFSSETQSPGDFVPYFDGIGRFTWQPWVNDDAGTERLQIGASFRVGSRDPRDAHDDAPAINTGQGFAMWRPTRVDAFGRTLHIIPSSTQWAAGGEASLLLRGWGFRGELYYVSRNTHEAVDGLQAVDVERDGNLHGIGWYFEASWWPLQWLHIIDGPPPELGEYPQPTHLELAKVPPKPDLEGLEFALLVAGVHAQYDASSRGGAADPTAPPSPIEIVQLGAALSFWRTRNVRITVSGSGYWAPHSGEAGNLAVVPGTLPSSLRPDLSTPLLVELGARTTFLF